MPCGFCGRSNITACQQLYISKHGRGQAKSNCSRAHDYQYKTSLVSTITTPCTNTPIICTIPGCAGEVGQNRTAIWKYNMPEHIRTHHPGYSCDGIEDGLRAPDLLRTSSISLLEEQRIGIPANLIPPKPDLNIPEPTSDSLERRRSRDKQAAPSITMALPSSKRLRTT